MKYLKSLLCLMLAIIIVVLSACSSKQMPDANIDPPPEDSQEKNEENKTDDQNNGTPSHGDHHSPNDPGPPSGVAFDSIDGFFAFHDEITTLTEDEFFDFSLKYEMLESEIEDYYHLTENIVIPWKSSQNEEMNLTRMQARRWDSGKIDPCIHVYYKDADFFYMFHVFAKDKYILDKSQKFVENFKDTDSIITCEIGDYTFQLKLMEIHLGYLFLEDHIIEIRVRNDSGTDKEISFEDFDLYTLEELRENFATK